MKSFDAQLDHVKSSVGAIPGWAGRHLVIEPAISVLASPSWRGVDGAPWRAVDKASNESLFVKVMDDDAAFYIDVACAFEAARRASDLGIGPKVHAADVASGTLVMEDLNAGWRVGTLERMLEPVIVDAVIAARRSFQEGPSLPRTNGVFDEIEQFYAAAKDAKAQLPSDIDWMISELRYAAAALSGIAVNAVPIHGDGIVSNIMISDAGEIRLIDWDRATTADPLEDLGSFLVEAFAREPEARDAFIRATGSFNEKDFNRTCLYGIADDLRSGLIGAVLAHKSSRKTFEFYKYASWRFLRCGMALREPRFGDVLRRL